MAQEKPKDLFLLQNIRDRRQIEYQTKLSQLREELSDYPDDGTPERAALRSKIQKQITELLYDRQRHQL